MADPSPQKARKYPRIKVPKGMFVGWKSPRQHTVSRAQEMGLGGIFLSTPDPPAVGSTIELIFDLATGEVRARAVVRHITPGVGMGLQFVQMRPEHRERLSRYLKSQPSASPGSSSERSSRPAAHVPGSPAQSPKPGEPVKASELPKQPEQEQPSIEDELKQLLELTQRGTYYQILGVTTESPAGQVKKSFYSLAQKFHPDHHMSSGELFPTFQRAMEAITQAYKTLVDGDKRAVYDKQLAASEAFRLHRGATDSLETLHDCLTRANECLGARNFLGSIVWLRKCVDLAPNEAKYHAMLARSLATTAQYRNEAIQHFETAIQLDPWNVKILFQFAEVCEAMGLFTHARDLYSKILDVDPTHAKSLEKLTQLNSREKGAESSSVFARMFGKKT
jgi:curved DNA-binding protein CbpA